MSRSRALSHPTTSQKFNHWSSHHINIIIMSVEALTRAIDKITDNFYRSENKAEVGNTQAMCLAKHGSIKCHMTTGWPFKSLWFESSATLPAEHANSGRFAATNMIQTWRAGSLQTVDIQSEIRHSLLEVAQIQSPHCTERNPSIEIWLDLNRFSIHELILLVINFTENRDFE